MAPTLGQAVIYHRVGGGEPQAAIVTRVWTESCFNLTIFDGLTLHLTSVPRFVPEAKDAWGWELRDEDKGKIGG